MLGFIRRLTYRDRTQDLDWQMLKLQTAAFDKQNTGYPER
jgi:hypothetical protein